MTACSIHSTAAQPPAVDVVYTASPREHTRTGTFRMIPAFRSAFLDTARDVLIYLPPGYDTDTRRRYPVLYLQDGQNLFDGATAFIPGKEWRVDETAQRLIRARAIEPLIIVGIYNAGVHRLAEYTPSATRRFREAGRADAYGRMIVEELKPLIDRTYRTLPDAMHTGIGGSSLGGLVSLYLGLKYPQVFRKLAVLSPSVWWDNGFIIGQVLRLTGRPDTKIWLDVGTREGDPASHQRNVEDTRALRDALIQKGWVLDRDLQYLEAVGAEHNEEAWAARVEPMLRFLFPPR